MNIRHDPVIHDLNKHLAEIDEAEQDDLQAEAVMKRAEEIAKEIITQDGYMEGTCRWDMDDVTQHVFDDLDETETFHTILAKLIADKTKASQTSMQQFLLRHAKAVAEDIAWREIE